MDEARARQVVDGLRGRRIVAHVERAGVYQFGIRVRVDEYRVAIWDTDGTAGLEAQVMRDGVLVGFVPTIPGSENYSLEEAIAAIASTDYDAPISTRPPGSSSLSGASRAPGAARGKAGALTPSGRPVRTGGFFWRLFGRS